MTCTLTSKHLYLPLTGTLASLPFNFEACRVTPSHPSFSSSALGMSLIFPYQTQNHCLPLIPLSICYGTWNRGTELVGWYKCRISSHSEDGLSTVIYPKHCTETIDLCLQKWELARANAPRYLPLKKPPPHTALPRIWENVKEPKAISAKPNCAKAFADDLPVLSSNKSHH